MTWLALRLFFGGALKNIWAILSHASFAQLLAGGLALFALVQHFELAHAHAEAAKWEKQFNSEHAGRLADRASYAKAQQDAAMLQDAKIARAKQQQKDISDESVSHLSARLQLISDELRKQQNSAAPGSPGSAQAGDASPAPCRAYDPAWLCLSPQDRLLAAQNEERHDELIDWNLKQAALDPNKP
jgi:hypothetical protein